MIQGAIILILAMVAVIGVACIFNATVRAAIARFIGGTFWNIAAFMPTWQQVGSMLATAGIVILIILGVSLAAYALIGGLFFMASAAFGYAIGWGKTGIVFGLLFPLWFFLFTLPGIFNKLPVAGKVIRFTRWITAPTVIVLFGILVYGTIFPNLSQSSARGWKNMEQGWANSVDKKSAQSEKEAGIQGFAAEDNVAVYTNENGTEVKKLLKRGDAFRVFNLEGKPADENAIGLLPIVLPNEFGDAIGKNRGWIASKNIIWRYEKEPAGVKQADYNSAPAAVPAPAPNAVKAETPAPPNQWIQMAGKYQVCLGGACNEFDLWKNGQNIASESSFPRGEGKLVFEAREISPGKLSGSLKQIGHPLAKNEKWSFENISCSDISCSGKYTDETGRVGNIIIDKMS